MKKLLLSLVLASATAASASSITLSSSGTAPSVYSFSGALVPNDSLVRVGTLTTAGDVNTFVEFGTSVLRNGGALSGARPSKLNGSVTNTGGVVGNPESDDAQFNGKDVYVWIYNAATQAAATERGLFKATVVPPNGNTTTFAIDDPNGAADGITVQGLQFTQYITDPSLAFQGRFDAAAAANADGTGTGRFILGSNVPEPSSMGLLALAGLALARRRR